MTLKTVKGMCTAMHAGQIDVRLELRAFDVLADEVSVCAHEDAGIVVDLRTNEWGCRDCIVDRAAVDMREGREPCGACALCDRPALAVCAHPMLLDDDDDVVVVVLARSCHECTEHRVLGYLGPVGVS